MKAEIDQISTLYNIEPIALNTGFVESLSSYLIRLAYEHNVSVGHLLNKMIFPEMDKDYLNKSSSYGGNRYYDGARSLNGYKGNSIELVKVLQVLTTRNDLSGLTLYNLRDFIPLRNLLKETLAWCPDCIKSWNNNESVYYPLIWYLKPVKICKVHARYLNEFCPQCNKKIAILRRQMVLGYCPHCFTSLEHEKEKMQPSMREMKWHLFVYRNMEDLILLKQNRISNKSFKEELCKCLYFINEKYFFSNVSSFSKFLGVPKTTLRYWLNEENTPSIDHLLKICFKLDKKILDFLLKYEKPDVNIFQIHDRQVNNIETKEIRRPLNQPEIEKKLIEFLSKDPPISMTLVAEKIGRNKRVLYQNFPVLCKEISSKYSEYLKYQSDQRIKQLKLEIRQVFDLLIEEGVYPSRRKMEKKLNRKGVLREKVLQDYWKSLKEQRGLSNEVKEESLK